MQVIGALDDLEGELEAGFGPGDELAGVAAVGPGQLHRGEGAAQVPQQRPGGVAVLDAGGGDQHGQQQPDRVDGDVPLAAVDLLARVVARGWLAGDLLGGLDGLGVDDRRAGPGPAAGRGADWRAVAVHPGGGAVGLPAAKWHRRSARAGSRRAAPARRSRCGPGSGSRR